MIYFVLLCILLVLVIFFFITYPIVKRRVLPRKFNNFCGTKIRRYAKRNKLNFIEKVELQNYDSKYLKINHILFGKKYIYVISDYCLTGEVKGSLEDSSWLYKKYGEQVSNYVDNLLNVSNENIRDFAGIISKKVEIIIGISIIPNECDFKIKGSKIVGNYVIRYAFLNQLLNQLESQNIGDLDKEQLKENYELVLEKNGR